MKVPETWNPPLYEQGDDLVRYCRLLVRSLGSRLDELSRAVNANATRDVQTAGTGTGVVRMAGSNGGDSAGWIEMEENKWTPYWTTPGP